MNRRLLAASALAIPALALAGCAGAPSAEDEASPSADGDAFRIVASTSVYSSIAEQLVGDAAEVSAIIDSPTQDPHSYEATARDQLAVEGADLVILNGGGYDQFMEDLAANAGVEHVLTVVEYSHDYPGAEGHDHADEGHAHDEAESEDAHAEDEDASAETDHDHAHDEESAEGAHDHGDEGHEGHDHIEGFNEHVWYDPHTIAHFAEDLAGELEGLLPDAASDIASAEEAFLADIEGLESSLDDVAAEHTGAKVFFTEPVGGYLTAAAGLEDATTEGFAEAVEEGQDVAPATLLAALESIEAGDIDVLVTNTQTGGSETERVIEAAEGAGIPVVEYSETLPEGDTYTEWMAANIAALSDALAG